MLDAIYEKYADKTLSFWCIVFTKERWKYVKHKVLLYTRKTNWDFDVVCDGYELYDLMQWNIIWHPITLARVLSVLDTSRKNWHIETHQYKDWSFLIFTDKSNMPVCGRKLLNENWSDATLDDQSDETIQAIYNILFPTT